VPQQRPTEGRVAAVAGRPGVEEGGLVPKDMQIGGRGGGRKQAGTAMLSPHGEGPGCVAMGHTRA
jgi:hypothetical protein